MEMTLLVLFEAGDESQSRTKMLRQNAIFYFTLPLKIQISLPLKFNVRFVVLSFLLQNHAFDIEMGEGGKLFCK